ncbi:VanZ family protein [Paenibacillus sp. FSL W8-0194]|uniref:VanZ family protein n=1 Tax=Paenibacillus sp. FSL W8-0194 TaxID=2921711 RepID=UPI0030D982E2
MKIKKRQIKWIFRLYLFLIFILVGVKFTGNTDVLINRIKDRLELIKEGYWHIQLTPFRTIWSAIKLYILYDIGGPGLFNFMANIILFVPMGFLIALLLPKSNFWKVFVYSLGIVLSIEIFQFITILGVAEIDDVILNTLGASIGYTVYLVFKPLVDKHIESISDRTSSVSGL